MDTDLTLYTLYRFAVYAARERIPFDRRALEATLSESDVRSFGALIDLDEPERNALGRSVLRNLDIEVRTDGRPSALPNGRPRLSARRALTGSAGSRISPPTR